MRKCIGGKILKCICLLRRVPAGTGHYTVLRVWQGAPVVDVAFLWSYLNCCVCNTMMYSHVYLHMQDMQSESSLESISPPSITCLSALM